SGRRSARRRARGAGIAAAERRWRSARAEDFWTRRRKSRPRTRSTRRGAGAFGRRHAPGGGRRPGRPIAPPRHSPPSKVRRDYDFAFFEGDDLPERLRATASRMSALKADASTPSPSWMSIARRTFPSRLELKRRAGSLRDAPLAKVSFTTFL